MAGNGSRFDRDQPPPLTSTQVRPDTGTASSAEMLATPIVNIRPVGASLGRGTRLGRYAIVARIGSGGMGDVYSAHDSELDRKVAIKLVRTESVADDSSTGRARLLREAQAMARLSHPNVVAVYDMGTFSGQVFIAMEYVQGRTLRRWSAEGSRSWREIVGVFIEAG
ncbi:MAG TPA: protein kinase, partial [Myxococcaceae bacterium]|nr:protein kinase [Myxococcaceae bacterium]